VVGLIRNPDQAEDVRAAGAEPFPCDLEREGVEEISSAITAADAVVFAAGAGPGSGAERKWSHDRDGAVKLVEAARSAGVPRYLIISSIGAENPPEGDDVFSVYLRAKAEADAAVQASDRQWTIVRPGRLTDDPGTGRARIEAFPFQGSVPREDVAAVLAALLPDARANGRVLYVNGGEEPIESAAETALG
jgi:nucleoside-diphosphate-sugar epimerase